MKTDTTSESIVFVVDDDEGVRNSLRRLFKLAGLRAEMFASALEFLQAYRTEQRGCLLLDVRMPGMTGLELQAVLSERHIELPIIFLTGSSDIPMAVAAMKAGAEDFLEKPFEPEILVDRVRDVIRRDADDRAPLRHVEFEHKLAQLTPREREVAQMVIAGKTNKMVASFLGMSHRTVEVHRSRIMRKMNAATLADLIRMALR